MQLYDKDLLSGSSCYSGGGVCSSLYVMMICVIAELPVENR